MRVQLKTVQELINSGFTTDMEGNLKKDGVFIDIRDARVYSGTWQDACLYKDERVLLSTDLCKDSSTSISGGGIARHIK